MNPTELTSKTLYTKIIPDFGTFSLRPLVLENDISLLHEWVTKPYAVYWGMQDYSLADVHQAYEAIEALAYHDALIGLYNGQPAFLMERYKAANDLIAEYYPVAEGDYGMHLLVAPATQKIHGFTRYIFQTVLDYLFSDPLVHRIVVEPDVQNTKIHALNTKMGFQYQDTIQLPHKTAALAFCTRSDYEQNTTHSDLTGLRDL